MNVSPLLDLMLIFGQLSLLAFGGGLTVLPEMQRQVTELHGWMTAREFAALFALAQAAPGPNMLVVALIGWRVAGLIGALTAVLSLCGPSSILAFFSVRLWFRLRDAPWRRAVQAGLLPITAGLTMAAAVLLTEATTLGWATGAVTAAAALLFLFTRVHPLIVMGLAAALGATGVFA